MMSPWGTVHEDTRRRKWGLDQDIMPTTWGADWDYFGTADRCRHTLYPCPCWLQEASIVTIPPFQTSYPHELDQNLQLSYHMCGHYLFARAYNDLILVVLGYEIWFMWWTFLEHIDLISISGRVCVMFSVQECCHHFVPKCQILLFSGSEGLVVWWWFE